MDPALTDVGKKQAQIAKSKLKDIKFDAIYSSDLERAYHTGEIIYGSPIPKANQLYDLRERNYGSLDGKPNYHWDAANEKKKSMTQHKRLHYKHVPDMESDHELIQRFIAALEKIAKQHYGKTVLVVAHGGAIRATITMLKNFGYNELPPGSFGNAGFAELIYKNNKFEVKKINP